MIFGSKLPGSTSALCERGSEDPDDQVLNPVKNLIPSPFLLSSLLSLVWWNKDTTLDAYKSNILSSLNELHINPGYKQLFISYFIRFSPSDKEIKVHKHIINRVINKRRYSESCCICTFIGGIMALEAINYIFSRNQLWQLFSLLKKTDKKQYVQKGDN